ncbi:MAG: response regulator [Deltaproteobacteria bacterium]|nr:response regulator [Deltaproteobacteria bacterium]
MEKATILVADDSQLFQELFHDLLVRKGYDIVQAFDGKEALEIFNSRHPQVVMLDVMMPRFNGMEVLKHIKSASPDTLVVMMTAHGSEETAVEAMKLGADDYLTKPVSYKEVLSLIETLLEKNRTRLENIRLKEKIHETEAYLAHLIDNVNEAIISADESGRIKSFNIAAQRLWHVEEEAMLGQPISALFKNSSESGYVDNILSLTKEEGRYSGEFVFVRKGEGDFPGYLSTSVIKGAKGKKGGVVAVIRDLTNEKRLREQLIESARLASLGKVVDGIAHEIRNPLISMGGFARRLGKAFPEESEYKKYLQIILHDVGRLEKMVKDIEAYVNFTKLHEPDFKCVDLIEIVNEVLAGFDLENEGIEVSLERDDLPRIYADENHLRELLFNLFENAVEAMPDGGMLKVALEKEGNLISMRVEDTGCGIPESALKDIYDPFYTSKMSGAGIGLAKVYMIIEEHHGHIHVESEEGEGTLIIMKLPIERRQAVRVFH